MHGWSDPSGTDGGLRRPAPPAGRPPYPPGSPHQDPEADLGTFALGRGRTASPTRTGRRSTGDRSSAGQHRRPSRLPGPLGLAVTVAVLLGMFGVGAALLPASFAEPHGATPPADSAALGETDPAGDDQVPAEAPSVDAAEAPAPTATPARRPTPTPKITSAPPRTKKASPTPRRTTSRASGQAASGDGREAQVLTIVNRERAANGCGAVVLNSKLSTAARLHSQDQGEHTNMSHTGSDGSSFVERAERAGYSRPIGENVAMGYATPAAVMEGWMNSSGHRANILNCDARAMGVGVATGADNRLYWTQIFGAVA